MATQTVATTVADLRKVLRVAEERTGVVSLASRQAEREVLSASRAGNASVLPFPPRPGAGPAGPAGPAVATPSADATDDWHTPAQLAHEAAQRIATGASVSVTGSTSAFFALAAALWEPERWGVIAGMPDVGLLAAAQAGVPLERAHLIPDLGPQPLRILAGLVDAYSIVLLGPLQMTPGERRRVEARVRHRHHLLVTSGPWPGARWTIEVEQVSHSALGSGSGTFATPWIRARLASRTAELWGAPEREAAIS